jgi:hypothetical protein
MTLRHPGLQAGKDTREPRTKERGNSSAVLPGPANEKAHDRAGACRVSGLYPDRTVQETSLPSGVNVPRRWACTRSRAVATRARPAVWRSRRPAAAPASRRSHVAGSITEVVRQPAHDVGQLDPGEGGFGLHGWPSTNWLLPRAGEETSGIRPGERARVRQLPLHGHYAKARSLSRTGGSQLGAGRKRMVLVQSEPLATQPRLCSPGVHSHSSRITDRGFLSRKKHGALVRWLAPCEAGCRGLWEFP